MSYSAHVDRIAAERLPPRAQWPEFRFDLPELRYPERLNAAVALIDRAVDEGHGDRLALVSEQQRLNYAGLKERSDRIARVLVDDGLVPGGRVLLRGPNTAMLFAAWAGVLKAGGIAVTTMPMLRAGELATIAERACVAHAIVDARTTEDWDAAALESTIAVRTLTYDGDAGTGALEARMAVATLGFAPCDTAANDIALIAFTSGTTGVPKGCVHFHRDVLIPADTFARYILAPTSTDIFLGSAPIAFTFGLGANLIFPWAARGTAVVVERPTPDALLAAIARERVTMLFTAPTAYKTMLGLLPGSDFASLRTCVSAGEHLPVAVSDAWFGATGLRLVDGIGSTEMMHIFVSAPAATAKPGATGRAVPGYAACVLDGNDRPMAHGIGRLAVKGPTGCRYLDDARQADYVVDGWNVTGDTFRLDEDGWFHFVARSDDMIVSSGYNIAGPEVEAALYTHPAVAECAVVGEPCADRGRIVMAYVVLATGHVAGDTLARDLQDHVKATIAAYKYPRRIAFVAELPKTHTGKIKRFALRR